MTPAWQIREGDALARLAEVPDESVQACITSPPYFGLRDYGTAATAWPALEYALPGGSVVVEPMECALGLESTPVAFVGHLVLIFHEVRRVLRSDGTVWLNIGDSYAGSWGAQSRAAVASSTFDGMSGRQIAAHPHRGSHTGSIPPGAQYKPKDLLGIPWLLAFALRADGWCLRSDIIWAKPNPMPESVTDRPTSAHEHIFLLSKCRWTGAEEPLPMRDTDAAWLAALVDGEGSICFQDRTSERAGTATFSVRLSIVNTNRALLERVELICGLAGVGTPSPRTRSAGGSGRPVYAWQVTNAKAARVIAAIRPYLIAKGRQADLALYVQALNRKHTGRGGHSVSQADREAKARAAAACSALNRGEDVDLAWFRPVAPGRWVPLPYVYDADAIREADSGHASGNGFAGRQEHRLSGGLAVGGTAEQWEPGGGRNKRNVWTIATQAYAEAHFATFPTSLVEPCILAGSSPKACGECGAPWERVVERTAMANADGSCGCGVTHGNTRLKVTDGSHLRHDYGDGRARLYCKSTRTLGWHPSCEHDDPTGHSLILDPFAGSGTTGVVALRHDRSFLGIELKPAYAEMARERIRNDAPLLNTTSEATPVARTEIVRRGLKV